MARTYKRDTIGRFAPTSGGGAAKVRSARSSGKKVRSRSTVEKALRTAEALLDTTPRGSVNVSFYTGQISKLKRELAGIRKQS